MGEDKGEGENGPHPLTLPSPDKGEGETLQFYMGFLLALSMESEGR